MDFNNGRYKIGAFPFQMVLKAVTEGVRSRVMVRVAEDTQINHVWQAVWNGDTLGWTEE